VGKQRREGWDDLFGLNIWWNLNRLRGPVRKPGRLIRLLDLRPEYLELMHPRSQGARVEAQNRCSPFFALDAPLGFRKDFKDLVSLHLFQGSYGG